MQEQLAKADGAFSHGFDRRQYIITRSLQLMSFKNMIKSIIRRIGVV